MNITLSFLFLSFILSACSLTAPTGEQVLSSGTFSHQGITSNCTACHGVGESAAAFPPNHIPINGADCSQCHATSPNWFAGATSPHTAGAPVPLSCASCHTADPLYVSIQNTPTHQMNHAYVGLPDCATCHASAAEGKSFASNGWNIESFSATANPTLSTPGVFHSNFGQSIARCNGCHAPDVPAGPVGTAQFKHSTLNLRVTDCASCHLSGAGNTWVTGM